MKVIFSRKGFDTKYGGTASPILPDGTLLSMPIPDQNAGHPSYGELKYGGQTYAEIQKQPKGKDESQKGCHLDPDIRTEVISRNNGWKPAFGQHGAALVHLVNQGVKEGDLFLFYGWYRRTHQKDRILQYQRTDKGQHVLFGYLQIGEIIRKRADVPDWLISHPHVGFQSWEKNVIFVTTDSCSFMPGMPGAGCLDFHENQVLTKSGQHLLTRWALPDFFRTIPISCHQHPWHDDYFQANNIGQEFVFNANDEVINWLKAIIKNE